MSDAETLTRIFLPLFFTVFVVLLGPVSAWSFKRRYGFDPMSLTESDPVMEFGEAYRNGMLVVILVLSYAYAAWPGVHLYLGPITYLEAPPVRWTGVTLLVTSLLVIRTGQRQLGRSWRFGIDRAHPPDELVTSGLFSVSRNPIFLGLVLSAVGLFLALPNAVTFAMPNLAFVLLQTRSRVEESFMEEVWGDEYVAYRKRVPRWILWPKG